MNDWVDKENNFCKGFSKAFCFSTRCLALQRHFRKGNKLVRNKQCFLSTFIRITVNQSYHHRVLAVCLYFLDFHSQTPAGNQHTYQSIFNMSQMDLGSWRSLSIQLNSKLNVSVFTDSFNNTGEPEIFLLFQAVRWPEEAWPLSLPLD